MAATVIEQEARINVPLFVTQVQRRHETEGDYDTAVDMVVYSTSTTTVRVETPYGLVIDLGFTMISSSHSYLEPDFDELEESGELRYLSHRDEAKDDTKVYRQASIELPAEVPLITRNQYAELVEKRGEGVDLPFHLEHYWQLEVEQPDYFLEQDEAGVGLPDDVIDAILESSGTATRRPARRPILVSMPVRLAAEIREAEARLRVRRRSNLERRIDNKAEIALYELLGA